MSSAFLTTPIYYVNAQPHLGHAYTTIAADTYARHMRQRGEDVFFLTGTDEHGDKNARVAADLGMTPQAFVDRNSAAFRRMTDDVAASPDFFIRTTDPGHIAYVQSFLQTLKDNGHVYEGVYEGLYCTGCEAFYKEDDLVDGLCPDHGTQPEWLQESNWFFRLSAFQEPLLAHYDAHPGFVSPQSRFNEARAFIAGGLEDVSLSRASIEWGVPLPWATDQTCYVWFDALLNYRSAMSYARPGEDLAPRYWPPRWQLLAKDILKFHAVIWPAMLMGAGMELPERLMIHGYLTVRDAKMSKSVGNVLDPFRVIEAYGVDALRYYLLRDVRFGGDGGISYDAVHERYHAELANDLGNLVNRVVAMIGKYTDGRVPAGSCDAGIAAAVETAREAVGRHTAEMELTEALAAAWEVVRALNRLVEERAPWTLAKDPARAIELADVLYTLADGTRACAILLAAFLPASAPRILAAVGAGDALGWDEVVAGRLAARAEVAGEGPLFPRGEEPLGGEPT
ncbi:MAG: methionine--tRNA ligase [Gaiellales bacterium]